MEDLGVESGERSVCLGDVVRRLDLEDDEHLWSGGTVVHQERLQTGLPARLGDEGLDRLGQRRLASTDRTVDPSWRRHDGEALEKIGGDLLVEHEPELSGHARHDVDGRALDLDPKPLGGADRVGEDVRRRGEVGLLAVHVGHLVTHGRELGLEASERAGVATQGLVRGEGHGFRGAIVGGGPEAAAHEHRIGPGSRVDDRSADLLDAIAHGEDAVEGDAELAAAHREVGGVGVDRVAAEQLVPDRDQTTHHGAGGRRCAEGRGIVHGRHGAGSPTMAKH